MGVRRNAAALSADEKSRFVNAVLELKRRGGYDWFVRTHLELGAKENDDTARVLHRCPSFLPWHRKFLLTFEQQLQAIDASVTVPYWDWTVENTETSVVWRYDFLGGNGDSDSKVTTGPFAYDAGNWTITTSADTRPYLQRSFGGGAFLPNAASLKSVMRDPDYDGAPFDGIVQSGFRNRLEGNAAWHGLGIHNTVHRWIGGHMSTMASPNDPVFFLHHAMIDRLWWQWQQAQPGPLTDHYQPIEPTPDVVALHEPMAPWDTTPADMLDGGRFTSYEG